MDHTEQDQRLLSSFLFSLRETTPSMQPGSSPWLIISVTSSPSARETLHCTHSRLLSNSDSYSSKDSSSNSFINRGNNRNSRRVDPHGQQPTNPNRTQLRFLPRSLQGLDPSSTTHFLHGNIAKPRSTTTTPRVDYFTTNSTSSNLSLLLQLRIPRAFFSALTLQRPFQARLHLFFKSVVDHRNYNNNSCIMLEASSRPQQQQHQKYRNWLSLCQRCPFPT